MTRSRHANLGGGSDNAAVARDAHSCERKNWLGRLHVKATDSVRTIPVLRIIRAASRVGRSANA
jgi:hypothetical protein